MVLEKQQCNVALEVPKGLALVAVALYHFGAIGLPLSCGSLISKAVRS